MIVFFDKQTELGTANILETQRTDSTALPL